MNIVNSELPNNLSKQLCGKQILSLREKMAWNKTNNTDDLQAEGAQLRVWRRELMRFHPTPSDTVDYLYSKYVMVVTLGWSFKTVKN